MSIGSYWVNQTLRQGRLKSFGASVTRACDGAAGMSGYVTKPIKRDVLFERMAQAMSGVTQDA
jgi:CheY-like chemotaxis protein